MTDSFDPTEFRHWLYQQPCAVCRQPVTWQGTLVKSLEESRDCTTISVRGLYCPRHRRAPADDTEEVEQIGDRADMCIDFFATPEGSAINDEDLRALAASFRGAKP